MRDDHVTCIITQSTLNIPDVPVMSAGAVPAAAPTPQVGTHTCLAVRYIIDNKYVYNRD